MAIYGQSWRQPFGAQFSGNMSFRNPMSKAAMNNNPTGNQQTLKPINQSSLTPMSYSRDGVSRPETFADAEFNRRYSISSVNDVNAPPPVNNLGSSDVGFLKNGIRPAVFPFPRLVNNPGGHPATIDSPGEFLETYRQERGGAGPDMAQFLPKNNPAAPVPQGLRQPTPALRPAPVGMSMPNGLDAFQPTPALRPAPSPAIPTADPQTPSPQGMSLNPAAMQNQGIIQNPAMASQAFGLERARQYQANRSAAAATAPQYMNPEFRAGQANMQRLNQSMAQTLNRPLQRRADAIAGVQPGPMINPNAARNVLMGQSPDADLSMRPLNLPPRNMYEANGITPGEFRSNPSVAMNAFPDSDNFRVATGGMAMYPPPAARSVKPEYVQNSLDNARIARAARMRGVTASGIDQWRQSSPYAQGILKQSPARLAALRERMQPAPAAVAPAPAIAPQVQPTAPQTPAVVQQSPQDAGINNWSSGTPQVEPTAPNVQVGVPQVQPDSQIPVDPKRLKAPTPYSSRIYPGMPRGEIRFNPTPNAFSSALRAFSGYQGN